MEKGVLCGLSQFASCHTLAEERLTPIGILPKRPKVIVISGPTSCGKTALATMLAEEIGGEIISADSIQVYRGMDIGTAKASKREQGRVKHHLLDILDVSEPFNVVDFYYAASHTIQLIHDKGGVPIVAGGSGFYLHALLYGPPSGPPSIPEVRKALEEQFDRLGPDAMYERLCQLDKEYAATITCHDKQKIVRALEIIQLTGAKVSSLSWKARRTPKQFDFRCWFLNRPKSILYDRIEKRCDKMIAYGLLNEVEQLLGQGLMQNPSACQAIGYRQAIEYLAGPRSREEYLRFVEEFKRASRRYAKRQLTWFRREPIFQWIDLDLHDPMTAMELMIRDLESR